MKRSAFLLAILVLAAVSGSGQDTRIWRTATDVRDGSVGSIVGTVVDIEESRNRLTLQPDNDQYQRVVVVSDSLTTQYYGFGTTINGSPEIFRGSSGFSNLRVGDRLDISGAGRPGNTVAAGQVTLLGRSVDAAPTGVGSTRTSTNVASPTNTIPQSTATSGNFAEGTVRQVSTDERRIVIQTPQRRMITINTTRSTPVYYRGEVYRVSNLEVGDIIRVEAETRSTSADEITARSIEVTTSVQDAGSRPADQRLTAVIGRVARVERTADRVRVDTGREEVVVDMVRAADASGRRLRASDLRVGDDVDITGSYSSNSDVFIASTVRFGGPRRSGTEIIVDDDDEEDDEEPGFVVMSFSATVTKALSTSPTLVVRDRTNGRTAHVFVTDDFVIRNKAGNYALASTLKVGDSLLIKAYRDNEDNLIAQTIRIR